jgi:hypothetical protein
MHREVASCSRSCLALWVQLEFAISLNRRQGKARIALVGLLVWILGPPAQKGVPIEKTPRINVQQAERGNGMRAFQGRNSSNWRIFPLACTWNLLLRASWTN